MRYLGTNFSITLGAWRLRFVLALEDAPNDDEAFVDPPAAPRSQTATGASSALVAFDSHAAGRYRN